MIQSALYVKDKGEDVWCFVATDYLEEHERQDFRDAAMLFVESDLSFGFDREYVYVVAKSAMPRFIYNMEEREKL